MDKPETSHRWAAGRLAQIEAKRRALQVGKVGVIVVIAIVATLVLAGHRPSPDCDRRFVCIEWAER